MKNRLFAALSAAALCLTALPLNASTAEGAAIPEWVPNDMESMTMFLNSYGKVHMEDDLVCIIYQEYTASGKSFTPAATVTADTGEAVAVEPLYHEQLTDVEWGYHYEIMLYQAVQGATLETCLTVQDGETVSSEAVRSFSITTAGTVYQNGIGAWLPDCLSEFNDYVEDHGTLSLHDGYIVHCVTINYSTGAEMTFDQSGTGAIEKVMTSYCERMYAGAAPVGDSSYFVEVYRPVEDGTLTLSWTVAIPWAPVIEPDATVTKTYAISEGGTQIEEVTAPEPVTEGDADGDGTFDVRDVVVLQKWLLCVPDTTVTTAADMDGSGTIDVFDLALMKRALTKTPEPVPQTGDVQEALVALNDIREDAAEHKDWVGRIARSGREYGAILMLDGELTDDASFYDTHAYLVIESAAGGGNRFSTIDSMTVEDGKLVVKTTTRIPQIATPDMLYRRYTYEVSRAAIEGVDEVVFEDTSSTYPYEDEGEVRKWYQAWLDETMAAKN